MTDYLTRLKDAIRHMHGCGTDHIATVPVKEWFQGQLVWEGSVEVFHLRGHPKTSTCYAWGYEDDDGRWQYTAVLELPPVDSAATAVRAALVAQVKNEDKET